MTLAWLRAWLRNMSLRSRLVVTVSLIISGLQFGEVVRVLSREVADLDYRVASTGTILAQSIAAACATLIAGTDEHRFDEIVERLRAKVDLVEMAVANKEGIVVGHSDHRRIGTRAPKGVVDPFHPPRRSPGLDGLFSRYTEYTVSAPILHGTEVRGFVWLAFRSREVPDRATELILSAAGMAAIWVAAGGLIASLYVRRITAPLGALSSAVTAISENRVELVRLEEPTSTDEVGRLQHVFKRLLDALSQQRAENANLLREQQQLNLTLRDRVEDMTVDLRNKSAYLEAVLACMEEGVITCDQAGRIVQHNAGAEHQLKGVARPVAGEDIAALVPGAKQLRPAVEEAMATGKRTSVELCLGTEPLVAEGGPAAVGGDRRTLVFRAYPLHSDDQVALGALVIVVDVTRERRVQQHLGRHDRLISLGTFAAGLAHELGNYLHTINGFSTLLLRDTPPDSPLWRNVQAIRRDSTQAIALLQRFLQFARPGAVQYRAEPVDSLLREGFELCAYQMRSAGVELSLNLGPPGPIVWSDRRLMSQVFVNLALNAIDALKGRPSPRLAVAARTQGSNIEISVADNGCGISPEHLERIFDPFFTTKEAEGTGLGLSIANQIVELHGGRLSVESQLQKGTTFHVILPARGAVNREAIV